MSLDNFHELQASTKIGLKHIGKVKDYTIRARVAWSGGSKAKSASN